MNSRFDFDALVGICLQTLEEMQHRTARTIDLFLVVRNWLIGYHIVEYEQNGDDRAKYGRRLIKSLSESLGRKGVKGVSSSSLKQIRSFYLDYKEIGQTPSDVLPPSKISQTLSDLLWSERKAGKGFSSQTPQSRFTVDNDHFYIDRVDELSNRKATP